MPVTQTPSVGRIVHFQTYGTPGGEYPSAPIAAIVTAVQDVAPPLENGGLCVDLFAMYPNGTSHKVPFADQPTPGHWNWPPRV